MRISLLLVTLGICSTLSAQTFSIPDPDPTMGTCNVIPFGSTTSTSSFANCRYQTIATAADLNNTRGRICALRFAPCNTGGLRTFDSITVQMNHTSSALLGIDFATNLGAGAVTVLRAPNYMWPMDGDSWNDIGLQRDFPYNGTDNVIVDIVVRNAVNTGGVGSAGFHRTGLRERCYATNYAGGPTGTVGMAALKWQVVIEEASLEVFGVGCQGTAGVPALSWIGDSKLGSVLGIQVSNVPALTSCFLNIGLTNGFPPFPFDLTGIGATGCWLFNDAFVSVPVTANGSGVGVTRYPIPLDRSLICLILYHQWIVKDPNANPLGATTSDYGRALYGN